MNNKLKAYYDLEIILVLSGKVKEYLQDTIDYKDINNELFQDSVIEFKETIIEKSDPLFNKIIHSITEKIIGVDTQNFDYAARMRDEELNILSEIIDTEIEEMFFVIYKNVGYYLVYVN
jgi:hypothetical protein